MLLNTFFDDARMLERICCGNREAMDFLGHWQIYVNQIDDIIDGDAKGPEAILAAFAHAAVLYSHSFYLANMESLRMMVLVTTSTYADSVAWEKSPEAWKREWSDHNRHCGMDLVVGVAMLCGGYNHGRSISQELRNVCYFEHHNANGKPV